MSRMVTFLRWGGWLGLLVNLACTSDDGSRGLNPPGSLSASSGNQQVSLTWSAPSGLSASSSVTYNVLRATSSGAEVVVAAGVQNASYNDTGLTNGTTYYYQVVALAGNKTSKPSNEASATPTAGVSAPTAPTGLTATAGDGQVSLSWTAPTGSFGTLTYNVLRATSSGAETLLTAVVGTSYVDSDVTNGNTYYYQVQALNSAGVSDSSSEVAASPAVSLPLFTWMGGADTAPGAGVYGTQGTASSSNVIGAREGFSVWGGAALNGGFWLWGGAGYDSASSGDKMNDLWFSDPGDGTPGARTRKWVSGANVVNDNGNFGAQGVSGSSYSPGARYMHGYWTDPAGHFWLFGGYGRDGSGNDGNLNDLWVYFPTTGEWTWVAGSNSAADPGNYGAVGVASASYSPSGRNGPATWMDASGNLWLFGGQSDAGSMSDLWKFTIGGDGKSGTWTLVRGSAAAGLQPNYGSQGVLAASNTPGGRFHAVSWADKLGRLWLFGGGDGGDALGDLWFYSIASDRWTWVAGNRRQTANFGTAGIGSSSSFPGARYQAQFWVDANGYFWLFGGMGFDTNPSQSLLSDLWFYNPGVGQWTWAGGSNVGSQNGVYGTLGVTSASSRPGGRYDGRAWVDSSGTVWSFGGVGFDSQGNWDYLSDLWKIQTGTGSRPLLMSGPTSVYAATSVGLHVSGGTPPYTFALQSGGGSLSADGIYTASVTAGSATVEVTDANGSKKTSTLSIHKDVLTLAVDNLLLFTPSGGVPGYTYSVVSGGGAIDSATGAYTPPAGSGATVTVRITDIAGSTADASHTYKAFQLFKKSGTFTVPAGVTQIKVLVIGGGGGGGASRCHMSGGGGGGSGQVDFNTFTVTPGASYTVTVGFGGAGDLANPADGPNGGLYPDAGGDGQTSSFGALISAAGGTGGYDSHGGCGPGGEGGTGGNAGGDGSLNGAGSVDGQHAINGSLGAYFSHNVVSLADAGVAATSACSDISEGGGGGAGLLIGGLSYNSATPAATGCVGGSGAGFGGGGGGGTRWLDAVNGADGVVYVEY